MKRTELRKLIKEEIRLLKEETDLKKIAFEITKKLKEFGFSGITIKESDLKADGNFHTIKKMQISPRTIGMLGPVFTSIEAEIKVGLDATGNAAYLLISYHWEHPRGSNGYTIRYQLYDGKWEDQS